MYGMVARTERVKSFRIGCRHNKDLSFKRVIEILGLKNIYYYTIKSMGVGLTRPIVWTFSEDIFASKEQAEDLDNHLAVKIIVQALSSQDSHLETDRASIAERRPRQNAGTDAPGPLAFSRCEINPAELYPRSFRRRFAKSFFERVKQYRVPR
jgi:hypothetical protein